MKRLLHAAAATVASATVFAQAEPLFASATWTEKTEEVRGAYIIERTDDGTFLRLTDDFETKNAPDLKVLLSPLATEDAKNKNALDGGLVLGQLEDNEGAQSFRVPDDTDFDRYRSVLIHCEKYTKLWGAAPLRKGELVAHGHDWTKKSNKIRGSYEIVRNAESLVIRLGDDFKTSKGPDLKLVLSPHTPRSAKGNNALDGGINLGLLDSHKGAQEFVIPAGTDFSRFNSVLIHCEQYSKLWGGAPLDAN